MWSPAGQLTIRGGDKLKPPAQIGNSWQTTVVCSAQAPKAGGTQAAVPSCVTALPAGYSQPSTACRHASLVPVKSLALEEPEARNTQEQDEPGNSAVLPFQVEHKTTNPGRQIPNPKRQTPNIRSNPIFFAGAELARSGVGQSDSSRIDRGKILNNSAPTFQQGGTKRETRTKPQS